jgi:tetratricopeptide (TPR) repeat protein
VQRNKLAAASVGAVSATLILGIIVSTGLALRATRAEREQSRLRSAADADAQRALIAEKTAMAESAKAKSEAEHAARSETLATQRLAESDAISKLLSEVFQSPDPARGGRSITVADSLGAAAKKMETELTNQPARRAELQSTLGKTYRALGFYHEAINLQEKVRDYYLATAGPQNPDTLMAILQLAISYDLYDRTDEALKLGEELLPGFRKVLGPENPETIDAMHFLANFYDNAGRTNEALKLREDVLSLSQKVNGPEHRATINSMLDLAISYFAAGRLAEALKLREEVLQLDLKVDGPEHPDTLNAMVNLAMSYAAAGRLGEAIKLWEKELPLSRKVNGPENNDTLVPMVKLAISYAAAGRTNEALEMRREVAEQENPDPINELAWSLATSTNSRVRDGLAAVSLAGKAVAATNRKNPGYLDTMAASYAETGQFEKAVETEKEAIALLKDETSKAEYTPHLELYKAKQPCRE